MTRCAGGTPRSTLPGTARARSTWPARCSPGAPLVATSARRTGRPGTASFHVGADIADAVLRYINATGDDGFAASVGFELLVETARLWLSLGHHDRHGRFHIDGVTGPDTYTALADDNIYTNLMAQRNLLGAADAVRRYPEKTRAFGVGAEEAAAWRDAAAAMHLPYDQELDVHQQAQDFTRYREWDFAGHRSRPVSAAQAFPVLRALQPAGGQAGRPGAGDALARRRLH